MIPPPLTKAVNAADGRGEKKVKCREPLRFDGVRL